jgi:plasmid maintenance system antidote protein VapI
MTTDTKDNSGKLFDHIIKSRELKNDAALGRLIDIKPAVVSKIRHGRLNVSAQIIINIHLMTGMSIRDIKALLPE